MPRARHSRINLVPKLNNLQQLFESSDSTKIHIDLGGLSKVYVMADKEQLMRVFINLVKNGLQSIPEGKGRTYPDCSGERGGPDGEDHF